MQHFSKPSHAQVTIWQQTQTVASLTCRSEPPLSSLHSLNNFFLKTIFACATNPLDSDPTLALYKPGESHGSALQRWILENPGDVDYRDFTDHSSLYLLKTPLDFLEDIRRTLLKNSVNTSELILLNYIKNNHGWSEDQRARVVRLIHPAYQELLLLGYSHVDLTQ